MKTCMLTVAVLRIFVAATCALAQTTAPRSHRDASVHLNQIQVIGSHNSYHAGLLPGIAKVLARNDAEEFKALDYAHADLATQLNHGIRQIELDIFADSKGGRFAHPVGPELVAQAGLPADPDPYPNGVMLKPGFKVMHVQDIDYVSNCQPFVACLQIVRTWSRAHPKHVPIFILVETKQSAPNGKTTWTVPEPYTSATFDALDAEILSVFSRNEMITPDRVRGRHRTLDEAVRNGGWPTLKQARGKVVFLMDQKRVGPIYLEGHPGLRGRVLFTNATPGDPDAAFVEENDGSAATISSLVREGYLVRTRADSNPAKAQTKDTRRRDEALNSGAQIVSTDYPLFEVDDRSGYFVALPNGSPARCNPVTGSPHCVDSKLEPNAHR